LLALFFGALQQLTQYFPINTNIKTISKKALYGEDKSPKPQTLVERRMTSDDTWTDLGSVTPLKWLAGSLMSCGFQELQIQPFPSPRNGPDRSGGDAEHQAQRSVRRRRMGWGWAPGMRVGRNLAGTVGILGLPRTSSLGRAGTALGVRQRWPRGSSTARGRCGLIILEKIKRRSVWSIR